MKEELNYMICIGKHNTSETQFVKEQSINDLVESLIFMMILTFIGGYLDAYTFIMRGGVFANNQTGNIAKLGIELYLLNWSGALDVFYPILATVAGAFAAEHIKNLPIQNKKVDWRQMILLLEAIVLLCVGFIPVTVPHVFVNLMISFMAAWQLSAFRKFKGWIHNTTISTGNMRSIGQYCYQALFIEKDSKFKRKTIHYIFLVGSFAVGSFAGAMMCKEFGISAIWICSILLIILLNMCRNSMRNYCDN